MIAICTFVCTAFCLPKREPLQKICSTITGDANLYTMFRLDGVPITCPFQGAYTFSYNSGHGECSHPTSTTHSCTNSSHIVFNYQACPDVPGTQSSGKANKKNYFIFFGALKIVETSYKCDFMSSRRKV